MDWLKTHINEVILPNVQGEIQELTGITLDETLGEFEVLAEALDDEAEDCEEFEITIKLGELLLVDACFLLEEVEGGYLPLCQSEEDLTRELIETKLRVLRDRVIPVLRDEFAQELLENDWNPKLAHLLDIVPEVLEDASGMRSSGGYPPMVLTFRHPEYDPDAFEVQTRIDPMASEEWVDWKKLMNEVNGALKAIGEERQKTAAAGDDEDAGPVVEADGEPSGDDLEDDEIAEIEGEAVALPPAAAKGGKDKAGKAGKAASSLLASLEKTLGIALGSGKAALVLDDDEESSEPGFGDEVVLDEDDDEKPRGKGAAKAKGTPAKAPKAPKAPKAAKPAKVAKATKAPPKAAPKAKKVPAKKKAAARAKR